MSSIEDWRLGVEQPLYLKWTQDKTKDETRQSLLSRDSQVMRHKTVVDPEDRQMKVLHQALKEVILWEHRSS